MLTKVKELIKKNLERQENTVLDLKTKLFESVPLKENVINFTKIKKDYSKNNNTFENENIFLFQTYLPAFISILKRVVFIIFTLFFFLFFIYYGITMGNIFPMSFLFKSALKVYLIPYFLYLFLFWIICYIILQILNILFVYLDI